MLENIRKKMISFCIDHTQYKICCNLLLALLNEEETLRLSEALKMIKTQRAFRASIK